jgi:hypothetical protein
VLLTGLASAIIAFKDVASVGTIIVISLIVLATTGWAAAVYVTFSARTLITREESLLKSIDKVLSIPFAVTWLRGTLFNPEALAYYWHADGGLRISSMKCRSSIDGVNVENTVELEGFVDSGETVEAVPMVMLGGTTMHFAHAPALSAKQGASGSEVPVAQVCELELGELHGVRVRLPQILRKGDDLRLVHSYQWPGAMAHGKDMMWFPQPTIFSKRIDSLEIYLTFDSPVNFLRGYLADLERGSFDLAHEQPTLDSEGVACEWKPSTVSNDCLYVIVFDRV